MLDTIFRPVGATRRRIYYQSIDGLRAIAVLSVCIFHLNRNIMPGGFVGVDVFFVISGFLITLVLLDDLEHNNFSVIRFYQRRIARIIPAFFLVIVTTIIAGSVIYSNKDFASLGDDSIFLVLSLINIKLLLQGNYFKASEDAQPFLHCWSLAVEEQFYLIFPIYFYLVWRYTKRPPVIIVATGLCSFAVCIALTQSNQIYAFYLLPSRAWELLAGAGLAAFRWSGGVQRLKFFSQGAAWMGAATLAISFFVIAESRTFPGWAAVVPVSGAVLLIGSLDVSGVYKKWDVRALLARPSFIHIGKHSYSLYLWHWPVFSFVDYHCFLWSSPYRTVLKIFLSIIMTLLTYRFVEQPARSYLNASRQSWLAYGGIGLATAAACLAGATIRSNFYLGAAPEQISSGGVEVKSGGLGTVVVIGDSQGAMYGRDFALLARKHDFTVNLLSVAAGNELPGELNTFWPDVERFVAARKPDVVVLAQLWSDKLDMQRMREAVALLEKNSKRLILLTQPPILPPDASRQAMRSGARPPFAEPPASRDARLKASEAVRSLASSRVLVVEPEQALFEGRGAIRLLADNGRLTYHDCIHLSGDGAALVRPLIEMALLRALGAR